MCLNIEGGINDVSSNFLVMYKNHAAYHLIDLLNFCISIHLKISQITPTHKKGLPHALPIYRPVLVHNNLRKVFENIIYNRFQNFCQIMNYLAQKKTEYFSLD